MQTVEAPHVMFTARRAGFTLIELLIVVAIIGILAALTAPFLMAAKASANEASAVSSLRVLNSAQTAFSTACGSGGYSTSLTLLVSERFASADIDITPRSGYGFALAPGAGSTPGPNDCTGAVTRTRYYFSAEPLSANHGTVGLATTQAGVIWQDTAGAAPMEPFAAAGTVSPYTGE